MSYRVRSYRRTSGESDHYNPSSRTSHISHSYSRRSSSHSRPSRRTPTSDIIHRITRRNDDTRIYRPQYASDPVPLMELSDFSATTKRETPPRLKTHYREDVPPAQNHSRLVPRQTGTAQRLTLQYSRSRTAWAINHLRRKEATTIPSKPHTNYQPKRPDVRQLPHKALQLTPKQYVSKTVPKPDSSSRSTEKNESVSLQSILRGGGGVEILRYIHTHIDTAKDKSALPDSTSAKEEALGLTFVTPAPGYWCHLCEVHFTDEICSKYGHCSSKHHQAAFATLAQKFKDGMSTME